MGGVARLIGLQNMPLLHERLARLSVQITKKEAGLNLPDKIEIQREVEMTVEQARYYSDISEKLAVEIEESLANSKQNKAMTTEHILTKLLRLAQITSGFVTWDAVVDPDTAQVVRPRKIQQINEANPKVEAVVADIMEELGEDATGKKIVFAIEVETLKLLHKRLSEELAVEGWTCGIYYGSTPQKDRVGIERAYNCDPNCKVLVGNQACIGEGLDLLGYDKENPDTSSTNTDNTIFVSQNWSSLLRGQASDRGHRRGTRVPVRITDYVILNTIDQEIRERVVGKLEMAGKTLAIGGILKSLLGMKT